MVQKSFEAEGELSQGWRGIRVRWNPFWWGPSASLSLSLWRRRDGGSNHMPHLETSLERP